MSEQMSEADRVLVREASAVMKALWSRMVERMGKDARMLYVYWGLNMGVLLVEMTKGRGEERKELVDFVEEGKGIIAG